VQREGETAPAECFARFLQSLVNCQKIPAGLGGGHGKQLSFSPVSFSHLLIVNKLPSSTPPLCFQVSRSRSLCLGGQGDGGGEASLHLKLHLICFLLKQTQKETYQIQDPIYKFNEGQPRSRVATCID
jgi:hypothetical protein